MNEKRTHTFIVIVPVQKQRVDILLMIRSIYYRW